MESAWAACSAVTSAGAPMRTACTKAATDSPRGSPISSARSGRGSALGSERRSAQIFRDLKNRLDPAAHGVVDALAETCDQRRQFDRQALIHGWLHAWLLVHLPLSVGMFVLMLIHTYYALRYM